MTTDAERLRAAGHKVTLADGEHTLVFDFEACLLLEQRFGGLAEINDRLGFRGSTPMADVLWFLAAGLAHEGLAEADVRPLLLTRELANYISAIVAAVDEAFPPVVDQGKVEGEARTASNGTRSITSPLSATAGATPTSGG